MRPGAIKMNNTNHTKRSCRVIAALVIIFTMILSTNTYAKPNTSNPEGPTCDKSNSTIICGGDYSS